jgi:hypothetical protein
MQIASLAHPSNDVVMAFILKELPVQLGKRKKYNKAMHNLGHGRKACQKRFCTDIGATYL